MFRFNSLNILVLLVVIFSIFSCHNKVKNVDKAVIFLNNDYAKYFKISSNPDEIYFEITDTWDSGEEYVSKYLLPDSIKRVVCMSTSHIAYMSALNLENLIVGVSGKQYISNQSIQNLIENGEITDIGYEGSLNYELLMRLKPDVVFTYGIAGENNVYINKIRELGITVVALGDYLEDHPIGKLEYLKLFGKVFNCNNKADSIYNQVKLRYLSLKEIVEKTKTKPKILLNAPWKEVWYIPGDENYMSVLIKDAGGEILLSKPEVSGTITYGLEEVYKNSLKADLWLNPNNMSTIEELTNSNPLFKNIPALKSGKIFNNTKRETRLGGSDFWEKGVIEPDVILNDLIEILHPELDWKRELVYYKQLK